MGCIYKATSKTSGKSYIGMTMKTMRYRRNQHTSDRDTGVFHRAIRKYGKEDFIWEELYKCDNEDALYEKEIEMIALYKTHLPNGYNVSAGGKGAPKVAFTDERRYYNRQRALKKATSIYCVELDVKYDSIRKASKETGVAKETMRKSTEDPYRLVSKYHFCKPDDIERYKELYASGQLKYGKPPNSPESVEITRQKLIGRKLSPEHIENVRKGLIGKKMPPRSQAHIDKITATKLANGSNKKGGDSPVAKAIINLTDGNEFSYMGEAVTYYNLPKAAMSNICSCCTGKIPTAYGYKWAYKIA